MDQIIQNLNDDQLDAVITTDVPVRIIAGAGSGKTRVITTKIAYLMSKLNIPAYKILAVTFTNKASKEMKERVTKMLGQTDFSPFITTFHSFCARVLREDYLDCDLRSGFSIIDTSDQTEILKHIFKKLEIDTDKNRNIRKIISKISKWKNSFSTPNDLEKSLFSREDLNFVKVYREYLIELEKTNKVDFDDLILKVHKLFNTNINLRNKWINKFEYILVDEFQDTNNTQYDLIKWLTNKRNCLTVVGDPDQTIYTWRGAKLQIILDFEKDYSNSRTISLIRNYRSTKKILDLANSFIDNNVNRIKKDIYTDKITDEKIYLKEAASRNFEAKYIAHEIKRLIEVKNYKYSDFFILYRINAWSQEIEKELTNSKIPFQLIGGFNFKDRKVIKDITALLRAIVLKDQVSFTRALSLIPKVGPVTSQKIITLADELNISIFDLLTKHYDEILKITKNLESLKDAFYEANNMYEENNNVLEITKNMLDKINYLKKFDIKVKEEHESIQYIEAYFDQMLQFDKNFSQEEYGLENKLEAFLQDMYLDKIENTEAVQNKVTLLTIHAAKGLENKVVFIAGLNKGIFPGEWNLYNANQLEEERRALYVAITRAEEILYLTYVRGEYSFITNAEFFPSKFIDELDENLLDFEENIFYHSPTERSSNKYDTLADSKPKPTKMESNLVVGDRLHHEMFGNGMVTKIIDKFLVVAFENATHSIKNIPISSGAWKKI